MTETKRVTIVGIGASAGGLEALEDFFREMPEDTSLTYVVVQHLSPDFKSLMQEILSRQTHLDVHRITDDTDLRPGAVYLIPPRHQLVLSEGRLRLLDKKAGGVNDAIDVFFRSLAAELEEAAIGVVLSGTGSDGARGLQAIKEAGGMALVQEPETAKFDGMPRAALAAGAIDLVLPPARMPEAITNYLQHAPSFVLDAAPADGEHEPVVLEATRLIRESSGIDFGNYKSSTLLRRLRRRASLLGLETLEEYVQQLGESEVEREFLRRDLLIGVTSFFRDPAAFRTIETAAIPALVERALETGHMRAWVTACSTGEEAYSLAMVLLDALGEHADEIDLRVFATDVDELALERAAQGVYPETIAVDVGEDRLGRFFSKGRETNRVTRRLREVVMFTRHDLQEDPAFTRMDLVSCRNLLIYLQPSVQREILARLHFALRKGGLLFLGAAETPSGLEDEFHELDRRHRLYVKKRDVRLVAPRQADVARVAPGELAGAWPRLSHHRVDAALTAAVEALTSSVGGVCLVFDTDERVLHVAGELPECFAPPRGRVEPTLSRLIRRPLSAALSSAARRLRDGDESEVNHRSVPLPRDGDSDLSVDARVRWGGRRESGFFVATLAPAQRAVELLEGDETSSGDALRVRALEHELEHVKETLQLTIEELQSANEEQQATNEELIASNEELQSTNEELHSVNEELYTVNTEHQSKIDELTDLNDDMDNLLTGTSVGAVFLDSELRIRKFTPAVVRVVQLLEHDLGRPFEQLHHGLRGVDPIEEAKAVLSSGKPREQEVRDRSGAWLLMRVLPYRSSRAETIGVVLTFVDVSELKKAELALRDSEQQLRRAMQEAPFPAMIHAEDGEIVLINDVWCELSGQRAESLPTLSEWVRRAHPGAEDEALRVLQGLHSLREPSGLGELSFETARGARRTWDFRSAPIGRLPDGRRLVLSMGVDVTDWMAAQRRLRESGEQLVLALEASGTGVWDWKLDEDRVFWDEKVDQLLGRSPGASPPSLEALLQCVHPGDRGRVEHRLRAAVETVSSHEDEFRVQDSRDVTRVLMVHGRVQADREGNAVRMTGVFRDITTSRETERAIELMNRGLQAKNAELEQFTHTVSHDLKTPLVSIEGLTGYLLRDLEEGDLESAVEAARTIQGAVRSAWHVVDGLLRLSRVSHEVVEEERIDLRELIEELRRDLAPQLEGRSLRLSIEPGLPVLRTSRIRLREIIENLLANAVRHGGAPTNGRVEVSSKADDSGAVVVVGDDGPGIPERHLERVFRLFERLDAEREGSGVGLAIVKRGVESLGGKVWAEERSAGGVQFCVRFPAELIERAEEADGAG
ncbi:MAG: chemotaxis protein CheB [Acidobacteriota bacterium]